MQASATSAPRLQGCSRLHLVQGDVSGAWFDATLSTGRKGRGDDQDIIDALYLGARRPARQK